MKTVAIIQARMGSTRLPGKVLKTLAGRTVLHHVVERVKLISSVSEIVVATTTRPEDDAIVEEAKECGVAVFRGSKDDVLARYYLAAREHQADIIIRITSDCPLIDPWLVEQMLAKFSSWQANGKKIDYLSNTLTRTFPRGLDAEVFTFAALEKAFQNAAEPYEREHVTPYIYQHPEIFQIKSFENKLNWAHHRWTLDTPEDFLLLQQIFSQLAVKQNALDTRNILQFLEKHPEIMALNLHIEQKKLDGES